MGYLSDENEALDGFDSCIIAQILSHFTVIYLFFPYMIFDIQVAQIL